MWLPTGLRFNYNLLVGILFSFYGIDSLHGREISLSPFCHDINKKISVAMAI